MKSKLLSLALIVFVASYSFELAAHADGNEVVESTAGSVTDSSSNETSPQALDRRLPPVLPGQEVTVNGQKMNVWSTAGEVPVGQAPDPWKQNPAVTQQQLQGAGVIIDQRPRGGVRPPPR